MCRTKINIKKTLKLLSTFIVGLMLIHSSNDLYAGTTGKIKGYVFDAQSGDALPGVNVKILETTLGAATDSDGFYIILNVPPGRHILNASYIGFAALSISVEVSVDLTTSQDFSLSQKAIEGSEVIVVAQRSIIEMDRTNSSSFMSAEQISELPVQSLTDLVQLQAGVVIDRSGGIHIRGGRTNEVAYLVDGVPISNQFSSGGGSLIGLESGNIQQLQVISGTFNAEYGQAQSGVINVITKNPGRKYTGSLLYYIGDRVSKNSETFLGIDEFSPINERNIEGNISGPIAGSSNLGFYFYGRQLTDDGFLAGMRLANPEDAWKIAAYETWFIRKFSDDPAVQNNIIAIPDSLLTGDRTIVPMNPKDRIFLNLKISYKFSPVINLAYTVFAENETGRIYDDNFRYTPDALKKSEMSSQIHLLNLNHTLNQNLFYNFNLSYTTRQEKSFLFENIIDSRLQTVSPARDRFRLGGTESGIDRIETDKFLAKTDLTWQLDNYNLIKIGGEIIKHRVFFRSLTPEITDDADFSTNLYPLNPNLSFKDFLSQSRPALLVPPQLTVTGSTGFSDIQYEHQPTEFAVYAQNTLELNEIILNMGLRYDWFNPDHSTLVNPRVNPAVGSVSLLSSTTLQEVKTQQQVSPRFGIAFPISDKGVLHVAYGHFFKTPPFEYIFENSEYKVRGISGPIVGNPDLKPQKTVAYEIGLQQEIARNVGLDLTIFYSDFRNLIGLEIVRQIGNFSSYLRRTNIDNGTNRGFTLAIQSESAGGLLSGSLDYTFQIGRGSESDPDNIAIIQTAGASGGVIEEAEKQLLPLDWDQRHTLNATLAGNFNFWTVSFIGRLSSGQPYTPELLRLDIKTKFKNTENKPLQHSVDMFIRKNFRLGTRSASMFLRIYNLYDNANELVVYPVTGKAGRDHRFEVEEELDKKRLVDLFTLRDVDIHQNWFSEPRKAELGISIALGGSGN